jgi:hypothetical protein
MGAKVTNAEIASIGIVERCDAVVRTGNETGIPIRFTARVLLAKPPLEVALTICVKYEPRVLRVELTPIDERSITPADLRSLPLEHLLRESARAALVPMEPRVFEGRPSVQQRSDDLAARAAAIYVDAVAQGSHAPGEVVATKLDRSRAQAARYIRRARELGLLAPLR